jgi:hypothetical protein
MKAVDFVRASLEMSKGWIMGLIADMQSAPLTAPTPRGGNHPLWVIGHLTYSEGNLVSGMIEGKPNPHSQWKALFDQGSEPMADASKYPSMEELIAKFEETRNHTLRLLETMTDADLDKPSHAPEELKDFFGTVGKCLAAIPIHFAFHGGEVADARRAAGRKPLMA